MEEWEERRWLAGIWATVLGLAVGGAAAWLSREKPPLAAIMGLTSGTIVAYNVYQRQYQGRLLIVWLRRFSPMSRAEWWFSRALASAARGIGTPVTLRDRSVPSDGGAFKRAAMPLLLVIALTSLARTWVLSLCRDIGAPETGKLASWVFAGLGAVVLALVFSSYGYKDLRGGAQASGLASLAKKIRHRPGFGTLGLQVLGTPPEQWQQCVRQILSVADIVVFDSTEMTDNLGWELDIVMEQVGVKRLLIVTSSSAPPPLFQDLLDRAATFSGVRRSVQGDSPAVLRFDFPRRSFGHILGPRRLSRDLRRHLERLAAEAHAERAAQPLLSSKPAQVLEDPSLTWRCPECAAENPNTTSRCLTCKRSLL